MRVRARSALKWLVAVVVLGYAGAVALLYFMQGEFLYPRQTERTAPLLVMHGARDPGIAIQFGERLYDLANQPKRFVRFPDGGHDDLDAHGAVEAALKFVYDSSTQ